MNCQIFLNGTDITDKVISYRREHKICTGIGMLTLITTYELHGSFSPWDHIEIYEGGGKEGSYYVSITEDSKPDANITVTAQDNSKRLTDYFIAETYIITYPTYALFWITKFLTEMGINYDFNVDDDGSLLSNNTQLGLVSGYEQIMMLLQISGWYITFNQNDKAMIGKLNSDLRSKARFNRDDIIDIHVITHDKLLRNRVVVWGKNRPTIGWVTAEAKKITSWNYDNKDYRTLVISNSCIPTDYAASDLAYKALAEFTKPNKEKHVTAAGTWGIGAGDFVTIRPGAGIFNGKGLVTTFGTSMSSAGLTTNVVLDERCPRLFAFFDFGDNVYISTAESGVWRKNIQGSEWEDYSDGLDSREITDLHISANVLAGVTKQGHAHTALADFSGWTLVPISGLEASGLSPGGGLVISGFMTRACIVDRMENTAKFAVDTAPWENSIKYEPYPSGLMSQMFASGGNGILLNTSGFMMENMRSWIVEHDALSGIVLGSTQVIINSPGSGQVGGDSVIVFDIENDGSTDYLSAMIKGSGLYSFTSHPLNLTYDIDNKVTLSGFVVSDIVPLASGIVYSGVVVGSGWQYVQEMKKNPYISALLPYTFAGRARENLNGFPNALYFENQTDASNGPWGMSFYTINGNPSVIYQSTMGYNLLEMNTVPVGSGYVINPQETVLPYDTVGIISPTEMLGIVRVTPNEFDFVALNAANQLYYDRWDISTNTLTQTNMIFGKLVGAPHDQYNSIHTNWSQCIHQIRVKDFIYFIRYDFQGVYDSFDSVLSVYVNIVDLLAKTVRSRLYFVSLPTLLIGAITLYQIKEKIGMVAILGTNDGSIDPGGISNAHIWRTTNIFDGEANLGDFPELVLRASEDIGFISENIAGEGLDPEWYPSWTSDIYGDTTLGQFWSFPTNPNVFNFSQVIHKLQMLQPDPDHPPLFVRNINQYIYRVDNQYFFESYDEPFPGDDPPVLELNYHRGQMVGNPNQYTGFGYNMQTMNAGFTEGASLYQMRTIETIPAGWERLTIFNGQDALTSGVFSLMRADSGDFEIWESRPDGTIKTGIPFYGMPSGWSRQTDYPDTTYGATYAVSALNFFVVFPINNFSSYRCTPVINFYYSPLLMSGYSYATLERTFSGFSVIDYYDKVPRLDISKYSPLVVATDSVSSIQTIYTAAQEIHEPSLITSSGSDDRLMDFRYADFALSGLPPTPTEDLYNESSYSGLMTERRMLFVTLSGLYHSAIDDVNDNTLLFGMSGITQMETTNNSFDYQYFFVAVSGESGYNFYQKDNDMSNIFVAYPSGLPQSYVTRIRVDDLV